jgi:hypothetical protein
MFEPALIGLATSCSARQYPTNWVVIRANALGPESTDMQPVGLARGGGIVVQRHSIQACRRPGGAMTTLT